MSGRRVATRAMRVLVVTKIYPNAAEPLSAPFNRQQVAALSRRCPVEVLATVPWFPGARWVRPGGRAEHPIPDRELIDGIQVVHPRTPYVPRYGHVLSAGLYAATVLPHLRARRGQFDVMLGCWAYPDGVAVAMLGQALGVPTVVKVHGSDLDVLSKRPSLRWQMARSLPQADRLVAVSRSLVDSAVALGVDRARIDLVMNGVDTGLFHPRDRAQARAALGHAGDRRRWIVCVSRLRPDKGTLDLATAFAALAAEREDLVLALVGDGEARGAVENALRPFGDRVILAGARPLADVPLWMGAADVVTLPSHHEGTPNVLLEALACGRRVVATRVGGIPDVVNDPALGTLVPVGDPAALAPALRDAALAEYDPGAVAARGARGGWDDSAAKLEASLARAVAEHGARNGERPNRHRPGHLAPPRRPDSLRGQVRQRMADALPRRLLVRRGPRHGLRVALTFDDGPDEMTDAYLEVLARFDARATFFMIGDACRRWPEQLARVAAGGHELGGHGFTHTPFTKLTAQALQDELAQTEALLPARAGGPRLVRPPLGATSPVSLLRCARAGYVTALWSRDSDDCRTRAAEEVAASVSPDRVQPGDVVLLHEAQSWTLEALPAILENLRGAGYQPVTMSELVGFAGGGRQGAPAR